MESIKKRMIWIAMCTILGVAMIIAGTVLGKNAVPMGIVLVVMGIIKIVQLYKIKNSPKLLEEYNIKMNDERNIYLAMKSYSTAFWVCIYAECAVLCVLAILSMEGITTILASMICAKIIIYLIIRHYYNKKN